MGIHGLLPQLKSIMVPIHIKDLNGSSVAIDTYSWLHKGALSCSTNLCKGIPTTRHIEYCMHRVNLLRHFGVKPILVFDGGLLPMKGDQENKRARARKENFERAVQHESDGNSTAAFECYQKAVDISPVIALDLIQVLKQENVQYIVAPYEADAQMTFLAITRQVDAVITEDSDLIPFGCPRIIFKMDKFGQGVQFQYSMLEKNKELSFEGFNRQMLLEMCILSGCDYLQSLPGMGLKRAHAIIKKFKSYDKVLKHLRYSGVSVPPFYEESFKKAILTFQYQRVYDPINEDIVHLSTIPDDSGDELDFLGPPMPKNIAQGIAKGDLDPFTKMPFEGQNLTAKLAIAGTFQFKTPESVKKKIDLPVQKNLLTKYFCFASVEAKRNFRAPRISPTTANESTFDFSSGSPLEHETLEATASGTKNSAISVVSSENWGSSPPANNHIENSLSSTVSEFAESPCHVYMVDEKKISTEHTILRQPRQPIHKPCLGSHKEDGHTNAEDTVEVKTREETKVIVRSAYFQHKQVEDNDPNEKQDHLSKAGNKVTVRSRYFQHKEVENNDCNEKQDHLSKSGIVTSAYFQHKQVQNSDCDERQDHLSNAGDKVIVRSRHFQHKEVENNVCDKKQDHHYKPVALKGEKRNAISDRCMENKDLKRKISSNDKIQIENLQPRQMRHASPHNNGNCDQPVDRSSTENNADEKFSANISHLGHYSEIAEKSVERFASVISSFRCSSGSRASGLRAPMKDVRNTCDNRPTTVDFRQYAYEPKQKKTRRIGRGS
ncbi:PREDICTED: exonuclease 1 isoform X6 [Lupinus angustifolius]|uniref:exonuclease 1 isoform X6 n=1 Tax=Lupinus angustifolius TaxID=3871 RepID=UPI00092EB47D|nr:PREDICTED: exonuclease 1 isoform X6 [Lupinus angustifolius]